MPKIIAFTSPKGGNGATFVCSGTWRGLLDRSYNVLAMDMCFERCTLDSALGYESDYVYTMSDVVQENCTLEEAMSMSMDSGFIRCDYDICSFNTDKAFEIVKNSSFDYILVDLTSADEEIISGVLKHIDMLVYVTEPNLTSVKLCCLWSDKYGFENSFVIVNKIIPSYIQAGIHLTIDEIIDMTSSPLLGLVPWSHKSEILLKQGFKFGIDDPLLTKIFDNIARRITGEYVSAYELKNVYDCFKLGRKFGIKSD